MSKEELILNYIRNFNPENKISKGLILTGLPGIGKTYLMTKIIPSLIDIKPIIYNASLSRDKAFFNKIRQECQTYDVSGSDKIIILDECEELPTNQLKKVLETTKVPVVLICNFLDEIDYEIQKICDIVGMDRPFDWQLEKYIVDISRDSFDTTPLPLPLETIKNIAHTARSYRHAKQLLENEYDDGLVNRTPIEQVQASLRGEFIGISEWKLKSEDLIEWMACTTMNSKLLSLANRRLRVNQDDVYRYLSLIRSSNTVKYPHTWRLISEVKREKREREEGKEDHKKKYEPRTKVRIIEVEHTTGTFTQQEINKIIEEKSIEKQVEKVDEWI